MGIVKAEIIKEEYLNISISQISHCRWASFFPQNGLTLCIFLLTRPSKAGKESFLRQILLSDLRLDTYERKQTKIVSDL